MRRITLVVLFGLSAICCFATKFPTDFSTAELIVVDPSAADSSFELCARAEGTYFTMSWWQYYDGKWTQLPSDTACVQVTLPSDTTKDIYFYFYSERILAEQIVNGDFELGNVGFTSEYEYKTPTGSSTLYPEGAYTITTSVPLVHSSSPKPECEHDHTSGSGYMMAVNGGQDTGKKVWAQIVNDLLPNTDYVFSAWVMNWDSGNQNLALLEFSINDELQGEQFSPEGGYGNWTQLYTIWNSGSNTSASIKLINQQSATQGNDFAVDDIHFSQIEDNTRFVHYVFAKKGPGPKPDPEPETCLENRVYRKWTDFMFCDNSDSTITAYQWYCKDEPISGATKQYLYLGASPHGTYYVVVTLQNGEKRATCPHTFEELPASAMSKTTDRQVYKVMRNGHLYIINNTTVYDLMGRKHEE